jgi:uncharacterized protein YjbI with pentapeptide repeats
MSEQDGAQASTKQRQSRNTLPPHQQNDKQAPATVLHPANDDAEAWKAYWKQQGQIWRTEPEISQERQEYLAERRNTEPDYKQGIFPFKDIKLSRADLEWLLATHNNGQGPLTFEYNSQGLQQARGLDLRGADLRFVDLHRLPLVELRGGLLSEEWYNSTAEQREAAAIHLEGADLSRAHLQGAKLRAAHLEGTNLNYTHLDSTTLRKAHLEGTTISSDIMDFTNSMAARSLKRLPPADLRNAYFDNATALNDVVLGHKNDGFVRIVDVKWNGVKLSTADWSKVSMLGDEWKARQRVTDEGKEKTEATHIDEFQEAVRANSQLAIELHDQGLNEDAARFTYRAQLMQRKVFWYQRKFGQYFFSLFLYLLAGYGYKPLRSFIAYLTVIASFATAYYFIGRSVGPALSPLGAWVFSMTSFHGRGFFPGGIKLDDPLTVLAAFEAFVGLLIEVTFIATLTQRLFGK